MDVKWGDFAVVAATVLASTVLLTAFFSSGVRLLEPADGTTASGGRRAGAYACFAVCVAGVLFALWVIVPQFHG